MTWCRTPLSARSTLVALLMVTCLAAGGCGVATDAQTAVIVPVEWTEIKEIRHVHFRNRASDLEIAAVLSSDEEVHCMRTISWEQGEQLREGRAALTVKSQDGQYLDAWITVVPD